MMRPAVTRRRGMLLAAALLAGLAGCGCAPLGWWTLRAGHVSLEDGPAVAARLDEATSLELSWDMGLTASAGTVIPRDGEARGYVSVGDDWGAISSMGPHVGRPRLIAYTYVGQW